MILHLSVVSFVGIHFTVYCRILKPVITNEGDITKRGKIDAYFLGVLHFVACQLACIWIYLCLISIWLLIRNFMCVEIACWNCILKSNAFFWERLVDRNLKIFILNHFFISHLFLSSDSECPFLSQYSIFTNCFVYEPRLTCWYHDFSSL